MARDSYELGHKALSQINALIRAHTKETQRRAAAVRRQQHFHQHSTGIPIYNNASAEIPAFACMKPGTPTTVDGELVLPVSKPDSTFCRFYLVNGPEPIPYGATTEYSTGHFCDLPFRALYDTADGTPAWGQIWGPYPSTWKLRRHMYGFFIIGDPNTTQSGGEHVRCTQNLVTTAVLGKTDASHAKSATGTVSVWKGDHSADSGANISSVYNSFAAVATTKWVNVNWSAETPSLYAAEC